MKRIALLLISAAICLAQAIPNHYIVEYDTEPGAAVAIGEKRALAAQEVSDRRAALVAEHMAAEQTIRRLGGTVTGRYTTLLNAMAVQIDAAGADALRQSPGVARVYPDMRHKKFMDQAVLVHNIQAAWGTLPNGQATAGAGIKIAILDTGIDITHPAFQNFSTPMPSGFPITTTAADLPNTNNIVIVARSYLAASSTDVDGHGTGVAMIAAGNPVDPQTAGIGAFSGVAPGAWLGNYNVFGTDGYSSDSAFLQGLEDAVNDGMNVINYSAGGPSFDLADETGIDQRAIKAALSLGVVVVVAAGNSGSDPTSISSPAIAPSAIAVGGNESQRLFWNSVTVDGMAPILSIVPDAEFLYLTDPVKAPITDVATVDQNGYGCAALPDGSLSGQIALIQRGTPNGRSCTFDAKLNNADKAGAVGAIIYDNKDEPVFDYTVSAYEIAFGFQFIDSNGNPFQLPALFIPSISTATLPAMFVTQADGVNIKNMVSSNPGVQANLDFTGFTPLPRPWNVVVDSSSRGPTGGGHVKPDVTGVGDWMVTADLTSNGNPPYLFVDGSYATGTSDATPLVTGSVAVLMAQRPGLTGDQYRSIVVNSAAEFDKVDGTLAPPQSVGSGRLDLMNALQITTSVSPTSISFLAPAATSASSSTSVQTAPMVAKLGKKDQTSAASPLTQTLNVTNVTGASISYTVSIQSIDQAATPASDTATFTLGPGASQPITLSLPGDLAAGTYHGFVLIQDSTYSVTTRVPYWLAVVDPSNLSISILTGNTGIFEPLGPDNAGDSDTIYFRVTDVNGVPVTPPSDPVITTANTGAQVGSITPAGSTPGTYQANITVGSPDENNENIFTIAVGGITYDVHVLVF
ncbi:MAG: S8 family serine peptidase [Acidobacteriia bacterium]|nr:S8 family serine peptidase [Terriglobia bacterium]